MKKIELYGLYLSVMIAAVSVSMIPVFRGWDTAQYMIGWIGGGLCSLIYVRLNRHCP